MILKYNKVKELRNNFPASICVIVIPCEKQERFEIEYGLIKAFQPECNTEGVDIPYVCPLSTNAKIYPFGNKVFGDSAICMKKK